MCCCFKADTHTGCYTVSQKNDTDIAHYNFNAHQPILVFFFAEMSLSEYAIKWWFVVPLPLASVSALPGKTWTPDIWSLQSCYIRARHGSGWPAGRVGSGRFKWQNLPKICAIFELSYIYCRPGGPLAVYSLNKSVKCFSETTHSSAVAEKAIYCIRRGSI